MPCGRWTTSRSNSSTSRCMPRYGRVRRSACLSRMRSTTRSPFAEGSVETRTSTSRPPMRSVILPSWGTRFSAMSSFAITLMRDTRSGARARLGRTISRITPSTRKRTDSSFSNVSMCTSDASSRIASASSALIRRMMGASSSCSSRSPTSGTDSRQAGEIHVVAQVFDHLFRFRSVAGVDLPEEAFKLAVRDRAQGKSAAGESPDLRQRRQAGHFPADEGHAPV